jgi:hypothetical protein
VVVLAAAALVLAQTTFAVSRPAEAIAHVTVRCDSCAWDVEGREAVVLALTLDDRRTQHLPVVRAGLAQYAVLLGNVDRGSHTLRIQIDQELTARDLRMTRAAAIEHIDIEQVSETDARHMALSLAPFIYARPDTVGRFTDVPVFMWYEVVPAGAATRYRYSVVFTNEDGGTPADRLMSTWGRTTDIEYIYSVLVDANGRIVADDLQGPEHKILPFRGEREGRHPLLWVTTDNNMVEDRGTTKIRYAPAPIPFALEDVSREAVMDANAWLYVVAAQELAREKKIVAGSAPGTGAIPDPRRFVHVEGCGEIGDAAVAVLVRVGDKWLSSDRGVPQYRIVRDGCFRAAIPLPEGTGPGDVRAVRVQAFARPLANGKTVPSDPVPARLTRINKLFMLDDYFVPQPSLLTWRGAATLRPGGVPLEIPVP